MEAWIVGLIMGAFELIITTILGLFIKTWWNKKQKERGELEALREEKRAANEQKRYEIIKGAVRDEIAVLENQVKEEFSQTRQEFKEEVQVVKDDLVLVKGGLQKDLYIDLMHLHDDYIKQGWISHGDQRDYDSLYWTYHKLGKNGIADGMHDAVMKLPTEKPKGE